MCSNERKATEFLCVCKPGIQIYIVINTRWLENGAGIFKKYLKQRRDAILHEYLSRLLFQSGENLTLKKRSIIRLLCQWIDVERENGKNKRKINLRLIFKINSSYNVT